MRHGSIRPCCNRSLGKRRNIAIEPLKHKGKQTNLPVQKCLGLDSRKRRLSGHQAIGAKDGQKILAHGFERGNFQLFHHLGRRHALTLVKDIPLADHRQPNMRSQGNIGLADGSQRRNHRRDIVIQIVNVDSCYLRLHARCARQECVQAYQHAGANHVGRHGLAHACSMRAQRHLVELDRQRQQIIREHLPAIDLTKNGLVLVPADADIQAIHGNAAQRGIHDNCIAPLHIAHACLADGATSLTSCNVRRCDGPSSRTGLATPMFPMNSMQQQIIAVHSRRSCFICISSLRLQIFSTVIDQKFDQVFLHFIECPVFQI